MRKSIPIMKCIIVVNLNIVAAFRVARLTSTNSKTLIGRVTFDLTECKEPWKMKRNENFFKKIWKNEKRKNKPWTLDPKERTPPFRRLTSFQNLKKKVNHNDYEWI